MDAQDGPVVADRRPIEISPERCPGGSVSDEGKAKRHILLIRKIVEVDNPTVTPQLLEYLKTSSCLEVILTFITRPRDCNPLYTENTIEEEEQGDEEDDTIVFGRDGQPEDPRALRRSYRAMILLTSPSKAFEDTFTATAIMDLVPKLFAGLHSTSKCNLNHWGAVLSALVQREPAAVVRTVEMFGLLEDLMENLHEPPVMAAALDMIMGGAGKLKGALTNQAAKLSRDSALAQLYMYIADQALLLRSAEWLSNPLPAGGRAGEAHRCCSVSSFWLQFIQRVVAEKPYSLGLLWDESECDDLVRALGSAAGGSPCARCRSHAARTLELVLRFAHELLDCPPDEDEAPRVSLCARAGAVAAGLMAASSRAGPVVAHLCARLQGLDCATPEDAEVRIAETAGPRSPVAAGAAAAAAGSGQELASPLSTPPRPSPARAGSTPGSSGGKRGRRRSRGGHGHHGNAGKAAAGASAPQFTLEAAEILSAISALLTLGPSAVRHVPAATWYLLSDWFFSAHLATQFHTRFFWISQALLQERPRPGLQALYTSRGARLLSRMVERLPGIDESADSAGADTCAYTILHLNLLRLTAAAEGPGGYVFRLLGTHHGWKRAEADVREAAVEQAKPIHPTALALGVCPVPLAPEVPGVMGRATKEFRKSKSRREMEMRGFSPGGTQRAAIDLEDGGVDLGSRYARALGVLEEGPGAAGAAFREVVEEEEGGLAAGPFTPIRMSGGGGGGGAGGAGGRPAGYASPSPLADRTNRGGSSPAVARIKGESPLRRKSGGIISGAAGADSSSSSSSSSSAKQQQLEVMVRNSTSPLKLKQQHANPPGQASWSSKIQQLGANVFAVKRAAPAAADAKENDAPVMTAR